MSFLGTSGGHNISHRLRTLVLASEKEIKDAAANKKISATAQKSVSISSKVSKKQVPKVTTSLTGEVGTKIEQEDTESFKDMMKQMMSKSNLDRPSESRYPKASYERRKNEVLSSIEELKEVSKTIGSSFPVNPVDTMQAQDHREFLKKSLEQMQETENRRDTSSNPQRRGIRITKQPKRRPRDMGMEVEDDINDIDINVKVEETDYKSVNAQEERGVDIREGGLSGNDMDDLIRIFSKTASSKDSSAAAVREVEEQLSAANNIINPSRQDVHEEPIVVTNSRSLSISIEERNEERNKQNRLRMYAAFDEEQPEYEGLLCPKCDSPCDEEEINDFGKCTFCRQIDLRDPSVHKLQHYDNTYTSNRLPLNTNNPNIKKVDNVIENNIQRQLLEKQRKEQQERLFSSSYSSSSFPIPNSKNESKIHGPQNILSTTSMISPPTPFPSSNNSIEIGKSEKADNLVSERSTIKNDKNDKLDKDGNEIKFDKLKRSQTKDKEDLNTTGNHQHQQQPQQQQQQQQQQQHQQQQIKFKNIMPDIPSRAQLQNQERFGKNQYREDNYYPSSSSPSSYSYSSPSPFSSYSSSSSSSYNDIEEEIYSDADETVSERFGELERQFTEISETLDTGVFEKIEDMDKIIVQLMRVSRFSLLNYCLFLFSIYLLASFFFLTFFHYFFFSFFGMFFL